MRQPRRGLLATITAVWCVAILACAPPASQQATTVAPGLPADEWTAYGNDPGGARFSTASQITPSNVDALEIAWTYRTGDLIAGRTRFQATPLLVDGLLFFSTPFGRVVALDATNGVERWSFDPQIDVHASYGDFASRGVAVWRDTSAATNRVCDPRIFVAPVDARLIALDAASGRPCAEFGANGTVDLRHGLVNEPQGAEYATTSPPVVVGDLVIVGSAIADNQRANAPSGLVRAFDSRSGALQWTWDAIPRRDSDPEADSWQGTQARTTGAANVWSVISSDPERDLVFLPTSSPSPDFYGGERLGDNRYANSLVALRATSGDLVWSFQAVHHDLWDYDLPAQPVLAEVDRNGVSVPVVVQTTKMGFVYVLDRETGEPVFPVEERTVPTSDVAGEVASATQPFPTLPEPLVPTRLGDVWSTNPEDAAWCRALYSSRRNDGIFTPPSLQGSILYPGNLGGSNWSGMAFDPTRGILIGPTNRISTIVQLIPRADEATLRGSLRSEGWEVSPQRGTPYAEARTFPLSPSGLPCDPPPWGTLVAIDLSTGAKRWEVPLGRLPNTDTMPEASSWGSINLGGPIVTETGLAFIAGTLDAHLRAIDVTTGAELWAGDLPAGGHATPMTYELDGRQYVVIAAGGHGRLPSPPGDFLVAFALPGETSNAASGRAEPAGRYTGYLRIEGDQFDVSATIAPPDDPRFPVRLVELRVPDLQIAADLSLEGDGDDFTLFGPFQSGTLGCSGEIRGALNPRGIGGRLAGGVQTSGDCSGDDPEAGRLMLDRVPDEPQGEP